MTLVENTFFGSQCMFVCDRISLKILDINENVTKRLKVKRSEIVGKKLTAFGKYLKKSDVVLPKEFESFVEDKQIWRFDISEEEKLFTQFSSHLINYKGRPCKLIVAHDLVSDSFKKKDVNSGITSPIEFANFPLAEIEWNKNMSILRWSNKSEELFGWTQEDVFSTPDIAQRFVHKEDFEFVYQEIREAIDQKKRSFSIINRNITKSGEIIHCEWHNSLLFNENEEVVSMYSLVSDISQRIKALEKSQRSMKSYKDLFDSISDAIYLVNDEGKILGANVGTELTFGYKVTDIINRNYKMLSAPGKFDPSRFHQIKKDHSLTLGSRKYEGWGKRINGEVFPTELLVNTGTYFEQEVLIIIERDVSERKMAEEELKKRENLLSELFNTSPLGIALLNHHDEVIEVNHGFTKLFGYEYDEISGLELDRVIVPKESFEDAKELTKTPYVDEVVTQRKKKSGELIDVIIYSVPIIIDGKMVFKYGIYVDISERRKSEEQLRKSLKEKEVLLAEIHHRVKNNLAVITGLLELQSYSTKEEAAKIVLKDSQMRIHSIALVHEKLYDNDNFSDIKIKEYIQDLTRTVEKTMVLKTVSVDVFFDLDDVSLVLTQAIPCGLLLNEILTNSYKHAFDGRENGRIDISFKETDNHLLFTIKDNGIGLEEDVYKKKRSSLGMKLIKTLGKQLNAKVDIDTSSGTKFEFEFLKV